MKKIILCLLLTCLLTGCGITYNLSNFIVPDDKEFLATIEALDTPEGICSYMKENFEWKFHLLSYSPYQMWLVNKGMRVGDCNDMSCFAVFMANYHGYETYQIWIFYTGKEVSHFLGVFVENNKYTYSSNYNYHPIFVNDFVNIVQHHLNKTGRKSNFYKVYNYNMELIKKKGERKCNY